MPVQTPDQPAAPHSVAAEAGEPASPLQKRATDVQFIFEAPGREHVGLRVRSVGTAVQVTVQGIEEKLRPSLSRELPALVESLNRDGWEVATSLNSASRTALAAGPGRNEPDSPAASAPASGNHLADRQGGGQNQRQDQGQTRQQNDEGRQPHHSGARPEENVFADTLARASRRDRRLAGRGNQ
jgi:hypothetical protein